MAEEQIERLGKAIRRKREALGLSIPQLAARLPVDPKTIERWELAKTGGAMDNLAQVAKALETTADELLADSLVRDDRGPTPDPFARPETDQLNRIEAKLDQLLDHFDVAELEGLADDADRAGAQPDEQTPPRRAGGSGKNRD